MYFEKVAAWTMWDDSGKAMQTNIHMLGGSRTVSRIVVIFKQDRTAVLTA